MFMICKHILLISFFNKPALFWHPVKGFLVLLYNSRNLTSINCLHIVCSIWPIERTLSDATTAVDIWAMAMKGYSTFPKSPKLVPSRQIVLCHIQDNRLKLVLPLCRSVGVFYTPSRQGWNRPELMSECYRMFWAIIMYIFRGISTDTSIHTLYVTSFIRKKGNTIYYLSGRLTN